MTILHSLTSHNNNNNIHSTTHTMLFPPRDTLSQPTHRNINVTDIMDIDRYDSHTQQQHAHTQQLQQRVMKEARREKVVDLNHMHATGMGVGVKWLDMGMGENASASGAGAGSSANGNARKRVRKVRRYLEHSFCLYMFEYMFDSSTDRCVSHIVGLWMSCLTYPFDVHWIM